MMENELGIIAEKSVHVGWVKGGVTLTTCARKQKSPAVSARGIR